MLIGPPDDSCDADEREAERALRDLRARVKRARAVVATTPGPAETLATDPRRAVVFYARFEVAPDSVARGVPLIPKPTLEPTEDCNRESASHR